MPMNCRPLRTSFEAVLRIVKSLAAIADIHAPDVRSGLERAVGRIGPAVIAASQKPAHFPRLGHELHAAVAAHIVKDSQGALRVARDEQGQAHELNGLRISNVRNAIRERKTRPGASDDLIALVMKKLLARVRHIRQAGGLGDRPQHLLQAPAADPTLPFSSRHVFQQTLCRMRR